MHSVIANVGIDDTTDDLDLDDETWTANLNQNLMGAVRLAREAASRLTGSQDGKAGNIVFISSIAGLRGFGGVLPYAVSKSGINQLAFELGMRLGMASGIRVNSVAPGNILFPGGQPAGQFCKCHSHYRGRRSGQRPVLMQTVMTKQ